MAISLLEWQALSFFEVEPKREETGVSWPDNDFGYEIERGDLSLTCGINPAHHDVSLLLTRAGQMLYQLVALDVMDILYEREHELETLRIVISDREEVRLVVKPSIEVSHRVRASQTSN